MKLIAYFSIFTGIGIILFWVAFFTIGLAPENPPVCYYAYEHSFPLPDAVLAVVLIIAAIRALKNEKNAYWLLAPAGGLIFLGLVDFAFNAQNGMYSISIAEGIMNACINAWCVGLGVAIIVCIKKIMSK